MRFSDYFKIKKPQADLDFVDIPLDMDILLFVDPYAISVAHTPWADEANDILLDFFSLAVAYLEKGHDQKAKEMLRNLSESNETHFGFAKKSVGGPRGRGVGPKQAYLLYEGLKNSKAGKSGLLNDLMDCELLIPDIGPDKISDIVIRVIKTKLIEFTQQQCKKYKIKMLNSPANNCWDPTKKKWISQYAELPLYQNRPIILIPKIIARYYWPLNARAFLQHDVLDYLKAEYIEAGSSLVHTLKDGSKRVYKKDLRQELLQDETAVKDLIQDFSIDHQDILESYKDKALEKAKPLTDFQIEDAYRKSMEIKLNSLMKTLGKIKPGAAGATNYHRTVAKILEGVLMPHLSTSSLEEKKDGGRKRIDIVFENRVHEGGFFNELSQTHKVLCPYIIVECKNYTDDIANAEFDQLLGRLDDQIGYFGIIVCRENDNDELVQKRCYDALNRQKKYVFVLTDADLRELVRLKQLELSSGLNQVSNFWFQKLKKLKFQP